MALPSHEELAELFEDVSDQTLGENICNLFLGIDANDLDGAALDPVPEEVPLDEVVLGA